jgi:hypothetical protein
MYGDDDRQSCVVSANAWHTCVYCNRYPWQSLHGRYAIVILDKELPDFQR